MEIGTKVKHSGYACRSRLDFWLSQGREPAKTRAKQAYDNLVAERGTITGILEADISRGVSAGLEIIWDNEQVSRCLSYMVESAEN